MNISKWLIIAGIILIVLGLSIKIGIPLGKMPGDFQYKSDKVQIYFPIVTCIVISILLSFLFWLFKK